MGGREFELLIAGKQAEPTEAEMMTVLQDEVMVLPAIVAGSGPFQGHVPHWTPQEPPLGSGTRMAATSYYLALVTAHCLDLIGHKGCVIVEGPFARNAAYCDMLAVASASPVVSSGGATGTSLGAALLAAPDAKLAMPLHERGSINYRKTMHRYAQLWKRIANR